MAFAGKLMQIASPENRAKFTEGFKKDFQVGREDLQEIMYEARDRQGLGKEAPMGTSFMATHPGIYRTREALNMADPAYKAVREERGLGLSDDPITRAGQFTGSVTRDIVNDTSRGFWWLINAPQAVGNLATDAALHAANRNKFGETEFSPNLLFGKSFVTDDKGNRIPRSADKKAFELGLTKRQSGGRPDTYAPGVSIANDPETGKPYFVKRNFNPGSLAALAIPSGIAINNSIGLLTPGGAEGYKAISPSDEDPSKSDNLIAEVGAKYLLGQSGGLLPYDEFVKVRPDVSPEEYKAYKAFKGRRGEDYNPFDDGEVSILRGALKTTDEGIHGPELQFMGKSLPLATGLLPTATAIAGTALGVRRPLTKTPDGRLVGGPARSGLVGGLGGLAVGSIVGNLVEAERRRRNEIENQQQIY